MRVLFSTTSTLYLTRRAVERARELDAQWAFPDHMPLVGEKEHHTWGPDWRDCVHDPKNVDEHWYGDEEAFLQGIESWAYHLPEEVPRHDPVLLQVYDELGGIEMEGTVVEYADDCPEDEKERVQCVEIPDHVTYYVGSYCGEWIAEQHRVWDEQTDVRGRWATTPRHAFGKDDKFRPLGS
jgi:hypothetical protein